MESGQLIQKIRFSQQTLRKKEKEEPKQSEQERDQEKWSNPTDCKLDDLSKRIV